MAKPYKILTEPLHLVVRFFRSLPPTPPSVADENWAQDRLLPGERELWIRMTNQDRRHSVAVARRFIGTRPDATPAEVSGALLHDVGKIECGLGTLGRVAATVVGARFSERFRVYQDHEAVGARLAAAVGSDPATVELIDERGPAFDDLERSDY
ncbi:MAG: HD domain-containing protein [Actinomycetota bacterium]